MSKGFLSRRDLLDRWRGIEEEESDDFVSSIPYKQRQIRLRKEEWFSDAFNFLISLPKETHIWCANWDLMGPLLETFHNYFKDSSSDSPLKILWKRVCKELRQCTQCICQHHQAQETYSAEYESDTVGPLLAVLRSMDEERVTEHLKDVNASMDVGEYDLESHNEEVVSIMFEVLTFPTLLDDQFLVNEFQKFIEAIDNSHELTLAGQQQYPGVYVLLFLKNGKIRSIGLRLAGCMGKLRRAVDLEPLQPLLKKCICLLEMEGLPSTSETSRPRVQLERLTVWIGIKSLLGFLEPPAFEEGLLERYPIFLSIVLNHVSDDTPEFTYAVSCLRLLFEMLGCKLWLRTTFSPSVMRNTLLGQCFHTRNEKSHKEIFDIFQPFLQSLEPLQDGEHERQRRHFLYFLLHQVTHSRNFSFLMHKKACKIALLIIHHGYAMNPPCPPFECANMWGPSLVCSLRDSSLHSSLRQPAFDLIKTIIVSDASALSSFKLKYHMPLIVDGSISLDFNEEEDDPPFVHDVEEKESSCWSEFSGQSKLTNRECIDWMCIPTLWVDVLVGVDPSVLPISFSKAVFWALSRFSIVEPESSEKTKLPVREWLSSHAGHITHSFGWEMPNGSDDGGKGKESRNSVKACTSYVPLIKTFKRCAAHFFLQMFQGELRKQWTWEPEMSESLILLLFESHDIVRQAARALLEYISKTKGLTSGLQFLCSSASSLSSLYLGLRHALKLVLLDSFMSDFCNLHNLFFIVHALLKKVADTPPKLSIEPTFDSNGCKFLSGGGFLHQPAFEHFPVSTLEHSKTVDLASWEKFCSLLAGILWPCISKCLIEGKSFICMRRAPMTCIRLMEMLPAAFERLGLSSAHQSFGVCMPSISDFRWLFDLVDWGKSPCKDLIVRWKQCLLSILNLFKSSCHIDVTHVTMDVERLISYDIVAIDLVKGQVSRLSDSLSAQIFTVDSKTQKKEGSLIERSFERKCVVKEPSASNDTDVYALQRQKIHNNRTSNNVVVVSDDETDLLVSSDVMTYSGRSQQTLGEMAGPGLGKKMLENAPSRKPTLSSKNLSGSVQFTKDVGHSGLSLQNEIDTSVGHDVISNSQRSQDMLDEVKATPGRGKKVSQNSNYRKPIYSSKNLSGPFPLTEVGHSENSWHRQDDGASRIKSLSSKNLAMSGTAVSHTHIKIVEEKKRERGQTNLSTDICPPQGIVDSVHKIPAVQKVLEVEYVAKSSMHNIDSLESALDSTGSRISKSDVRDPQQVIDGEKQGRSQASGDSELNTGDSAQTKFSEHGSHKSVENACRKGSNYSDVDLETNDDILKDIVHASECDPGDRTAKIATNRQSLIRKPVVSVPKRRVIQLQMPAESRSAQLQKLDAVIRRFKPPRLDEWYRSILEIDYFSIVGLSSASDDENATKVNASLKEVPLCFSSHDEYVEIFRPLVLEEFKAQLQNSYVEASSMEMCCGSICVLSVERIDDFHIIRCIPDKTESSSPKVCLENDLVLLTKSPMQNSSQVHMVGKVERREKDHRSRSNILVIRFYLESGSLRSNKGKRLLTERSKWYLNHIVSITPQLREFQALSALRDIPMLPIILNPVDRVCGFSEACNTDLGWLSQPLLQMLKSSYNNRQLQAINVSIGAHDSNKAFQLSLIQGPPGTGKTRTVVAIISGLLSLGASQKSDAFKAQNCNPRINSVESTNQKLKVTQSVAIARAWQDAAFARQLAKEDEKSSARLMESCQSFSRGRVLLCAQSNAAVDELVSRISCDGLYGNDGKRYKPYLVRVGNSKTVHPSSLPFFIDTLVDQRLSEEKGGEVAVNDTGSDSSMALRAKLEKLVEGIRFFEAKRASLRDRDSLTKVGSEDSSNKDSDDREMSDTEIGAKLKVLYGKKKSVCADLAAAQAREKKSFEEIKAHKKKLRMSILREAEIVVTTLSGCGGDIYGACSASVSNSRFNSSAESSLFDAVVIDEAAQALEPATLIPLQLLKSSGTKCIMVGDPKQLPATVLSNIASKFLFQCSMFERLQRAGHPVIMLNEQYRMHPEICRFPSLHFYDKKLLSATEMANVSATFHENHYFRPYVFFDVVDGHELHGRNAGTLSLCNEHEADAAVEVLRFFKKRYAYEFTGGKIGIITPYKRQLSLLRSRFSSVFGPDVTADMEFNTVDGFQGREVDILILSTVRASDRSAEGQGLNASSIGFVADVRRMNVALTRAKLSLWIIGSARTLQRNVNWAALLKDAQERNVVISLARPYESTFKKTPSSKTCHNLASSDFNTRISAKKMNDPIENVHQTGFNAKEPHERKGRRLDCRVERQTSKHKSNGDLVSTVRKHTTALAADRRSSAVQRKDGKPILEKRLTKAGRQAIVDSKDEGKELEAQQSNPIGTPDTGKEKELSDRFRSSSSVKELVSDVKGRTLLRQPSKAESEMNGHGKFGYQAQGKAVVSLSSTAERVQNKEAKDSVNLRFVDDKSEGTIATRKRQRDAIDALLSSALISSKKHDAPSRSSKRPLSPTTSARVSVRAPKPSRAQNASTNQTQEKRVLSSHCEHHHQNHFSRSRDLDEEWKSFKDLIGDS